MNILETIIAAKKIEVAERKQQYPLAMFEKSQALDRQPFSLKEFLLNNSRTGIIAEFKRRSPSKGIINATADVLPVAKAYTDNGAAALSVLTDQQFFGGSTEDLKAARINAIPILRKDFIIDEYQILEAKAMGADVILLIAACLTPGQVYSLAKMATGLNLEVLLELHGEEELGHVNEYTPIVGINNRNLKTFAVDLERSLAMAALLPEQTIKVAESGIDKIENILLFRENGFKGFLMGEFFMKSADPGEAFRLFAQQLKAESV
jgi:indole-3-glycerol phosphate synthase